MYYEKNGNNVIQRSSEVLQEGREMRVLILGINGFIGYHLFNTITDRTDWEVTGLDINDDRMSKHKNSSRLSFLKGDMAKETVWIEEQIKKCDVVVPLVAIATPAIYITDPLRVYNLDFEENMKIIKLCVKHNKRIVFPSTSEVYGMSTVSEFNEDSSNLVVGPICKQRWIYSCCKQLIDRVLWAHGQTSDFNFTLFRPFNWIGPFLDDVKKSEDGTSRVVTQFISNIMHNKPIKLVNGGTQKRSFTYVQDGVDCLMTILKNPDGIANKQIFNIGNPDNNASIEFIANYISKWVKKNRPEVKVPEIVYVSDRNYYGESYEDVSTRVPSITKAENLLKWKPTHTLEESLDKTLEFYFS
jgi:nucleoside-diphosphate-sugar epimerase